MENSNSMMVKFSLIFIWFWLAACAQCWASDQSEQYSDATHRLSAELRCLVCQNQSLSESNAPLAVDLKRQIEFLLKQGKSENQIKEYMVERYGDFILYDPPLRLETSLLWFGPFLFLVLLSVCFWIVLRSMNKKKI